MFCPMTRETCRDDCAWRIRPSEEKDTWPDQCAVELMGRFMAGWVMSAELPADDFLMDLWGLIDAARARLGDTD